MSSTNEGNDYKLNMLLNMGFDNVSKCVQALEISNGDVERAIDFLCQDNAASADPSSSSSMQGGSGGSGSGGGRRGRRRTATPNIVSCELSQYTVPNGKSACTCIALSGAESFLKSMAVSDWKDPVVTDKSNDEEDDEEAKIEQNDTKTGLDDGTNEKVENVVINIPPPPPPQEEEGEESKVEDKNQEQNKKENEKDDNNNNNSNDDEDDFVVVSAPNSPSPKISSKRLKQNHDQDGGGEKKETDANKNKEEDEEAVVVNVEDDDRPDDPMEIEVVRSCDYEDGDNNNDNNAPTEEIQINSGTKQKEEGEEAVPEKNKEEEEATVATEVASKDEEATPKKETTTTTLQAPPPKRTAEEIISPAFLGQMIMDGVQSYEHFITNNNNSGVVEHTSVEDVLSNQNTHYTSLKLIGSVRQGVLSSDTNHALNLSCILKGCREDGMVDGKAWLAIVITKTPETIIVLLPPTTTTNTTATTTTTTKGMPFILLDSHPRPHLTFNNNGNEGSYAAIHTSFDALIETLQELFPVADLGDDVPEMMSVMYNSFDVYPLQLV